MHINYIFACIYSTFATMRCMFEEKKLYGVFHSVLEGCYFYKLDICRLPGKCSKSRNKKMFCKQTLLEF